MKRLLSLLIVLLVLAASVSQAAQDGRIIREVRVRGNLRIETEKILLDINTHPGDPYDTQTIRNDIREIYGLGFFEDVLVEFSDDDILTFVVLELPALRKWEVEENEVLDEADVEEKVKLRRLEILNQEDLDTAMAALLELFREEGHYLARVEPEITPVDNGKNQVDLVFRVDPGEEVYIRSISLPGAETPEEVEELKGSIVMQEGSSWSWFTESGRFKEAELAQSLDMIRQYYMERGYAEVEVKEPLVQVSANLSSLEVTIPVTPGVAYTITEITFSGDSHYTEEELFETAGLTAGELFDVREVRKALIALEDKHADDGYAFTKIGTQHATDPELATMKLNFHVNKGKKYHIGRVEVAGNDKTRDRVIRRDVLLAEGELYQRSKLKQSERRLQRLDYFEKMNIKHHPREEEGLVDLVVEVEEKATGNFNIGAGYSTEDKFFFTGGISNRNFLGYGYIVEASTTLGSSQQLFQLSLDNPRVFDSNVYFGANVYRSLNEYDEYDRDAIGFGLRAGLGFWEYWRALLSYRWDDSRLKNICTQAREQAGECDNIASYLVEQQEGTTITSAISPSLSYDSRNRMWGTTEGHYTRLSVELAGWILGWDAEYLKYLADSRQYFPVGEEMAFMVRGRAGMIHGITTSKIPIYERFAIGGLNTLRGFDGRGIGTIDPGETAIDCSSGTCQEVVTRPSTGEVIGGNKYTVFNAEFEFPLIPDVKVNGVVFYDLGQVWDTGEGWFSTGLRSSAGAGIRWNSPMGPLRLEYGKVLDRKPGEDSAQWEFSVGGSF